jgi:hypothetical protein
MPTGLLAQSTGNRGRIRPDNGGTDVFFSLAEWCGNTMPTIIGLPVTYTVDPTDPRRASAACFATPAMDSAAGFAAHLMVTAQREADTHGRSLKGRQFARTADAMARAAFAATVPGEALFDRFKERDEAEMRLRALL